MSLDTTNAERNAKPLANPFNGVVKMTMWTKSFRTLIRSLAILCWVALGFFTGRTAWAQQPEAEESATPAPETPIEQVVETEAIVAAEEASEVTAEELVEETGEAPDEEGEEAEEEGPDIGPALGLTVIGTASVVGGVLYLVHSGETQDDADAARAAEQVDRADSLDDRAEREVALGGVLTALGAAALGVATYLWISELNDDQPEEPAAPEPEVSFMPTLGPDGSALFLLNGSF